MTYYQWLQDRSLTIGLAGWVMLLCALAMPYIAVFKLWERYSQGE